MMPLTTVVFVFGAVILVVLLLAWGIEYSVHKEMTIEDSKTWNYGTFPRFLEEFAKIKTWRIDPQWPGSLFASSNAVGYIHARIIRFGDRGMVLDPISMLRFILWSRKASPKQVITKRDKTLWRPTDVSK